MRLADPVLSEKCACATGCVRCTRVDTFVDLRLVPVRWRELIVDRYVVNSPSVYANCCQGRRGWTPMRRAREWSVYKREQQRLSTYLA